jgi:hypothetical protein
VVHRPPQGVGGVVPSRRHPVIVVVVVVVVVVVIVVQHRPGVEGRAVAVSAAVGREIHDRRTSAPQRRSASGLAG